MIDAFEHLKALLDEIDDALERNTHLYVLGGAVMLYHELKPQTKDIDCVVRSQKAFANIHDALTSNGFTERRPGKHYERLALSRILTRGEYRIDLFCETVCGQLRMTDEMAAHAETVYDGKHLSASLLSREDVFVFKAITARAGDEEDCVSLARTGIDWDAILEELRRQIDTSGEDVWITYFGERLDALAGKGVEVPILADVHALVDEYYGSLERTDA